jgi:SAM-dependent methyltransferase
MTESYPPCVCCGGSKFRVTPTIIPEFQLIHCGKCHCAFTWPQLPATALEKYYLKSYYGPENVKFISPLERVVEGVTSRRADWLDQMIPAGSQILEIGCGRGLLLSALQQRGHRCVGIERSDLAANRAKEIPGLLIHTAPMAECRLPEGSFDLVILWHVLEHLHDPAQTVALIHRLLRPGGQLILEVPNLAALQSRISGRFWFHLDVERHLYHFTPKGLSCLLGNLFPQVQIDGTYSWEQSPFGALQSLLNLVLTPPEALYKILKREVSCSLLTKTSHIGLAALFFIPALFFAVVEAMLRQGAVLRAIARKPLSHE